MKNKIDESKMEIQMNTVLNPEYMMTSAFHPKQIVKDDSFYAGGSVNEHTAIEEANEYLANKDLGQINNNL